MSNYPNYSTWVALVLEQHAGLWAWCWFVVGLVLLYVLWRRLFKRYQVVVTGAAVIAFYLALVPGISVSPSSAWALMAIPLAVLLWLYSDDLVATHDNQAHWMILFMALVARLPNLFLEQLWYDETVTAAFAQVPISQIWALGGDTHPPLFYFPFWLSAQLLGTSQLAIRLPSLILGVVVVYLIYRLTLALGMRRKTALVAALLVAFLPGALRYSAEARAYSQLAALVLGMAICVLEDRPRWFAALASMTVLTQNMGYAYVATIGGVAFLWYVHQTKMLSVVPIPGAVNYANPGPLNLYLQIKDKRWWWALGIPAAVGAAWLPFMLRQLTSVSGGWWVVFAPGAIPRPLFTMTVGIRVPEQLILQVIGAVLVITLLAALARFSWLFTTKGNLWLVLCFGAPTIAAVVSLFTPVYVDRAFLPSMLAVPILWAYLLTERQRFERLAVAAVLIPVVAIALQSHYIPDAEVRADWRTRILNGCPDTTTYFNTSLSTYFMARYYVPEAHNIAWSGANDINLFLPEAVKTAMHIEQADAPPSGTVCILDLDTPISRADERAYNAALANNAIHRAALSEVDALEILVSAYVVRLP